MSRAIQEYNNKRSKMMTEEQQYTSMWNQIHDQLPKGKPITPLELYKLSNVIYTPIMCNRHNKSSNENVHCWLCS